MNELIKIKEISNKYGITTKTLRYYEKMGLIQSRRTKDYAYRMYDEQAIKRLEQILILRRLSTSIKDIKRIFETTGSEIVLEILNKKADDIDDEIALLYELKEMVLKFIRQIKQADFSKDSDVKMLYEKAREIENQIVGDENAVDLDRFIEVTDKLVNIRTKKDSIVVEDMELFTEEKNVQPIFETLNSLLNVAGYMNVGFADISTIAKDNNAYFANFIQVKEIAESIEHSRKDYVKGVIIDIKMSEKGSLDTLDKFISDIVKSFQYENLTVILGVSFVDGLNGNEITASIIELSSRA
ncbi:MAG: MerR family transcriptional regulator [Oscillospiraceae bacterium]|nr:MerR family transcriptional regulator [Oscillospiraceae bacterium]